CEVNWKSGCHRPRSLTSIEIVKAQRRQIVTRAFERRRNYRRKRFAFARSESCRFIDKNPPARIETIIGISKCRCQKRRHCFAFKNRNEVDTRTPDSMRLQLDLESPLFSTDFAGQPAHLRQ